MDLSERQRNVIREVIGGAVESAEWLREGQNGDVVLINGQVVFKFPRYLQSTQALVTEPEALMRLKGRLPLSIPEPLSHSALIGNSYYCYQRLPGEPLHRAVMDRIVDKQTAAQKLGGFLYQLHGLPVALLDGLALPEADTQAHWREFYHRVSTLLFPQFRPDAIEPVRWAFVRFLNRKANFRVLPVIIHGDFGPGNILYDRESGALGIIDFGGVRLGDPAADIASMIGPVGYGEGFLKLLAGSYPGLDQLLERARFYAGTFALEEALFGLETGDREAYQAGMKRYL